MNFEDSHVNKFMKIYVFIYIGCINVYNACTLGNWLEINKLVIVIKSFIFFIYHAIVTTTCHSLNGEFVKKRLKNQKNTHIHFTMHSHCFEVGVPQFVILWMVKSHWHLTLLRRAHTDTETSFVFSCKPSKELSAL